MLKSIAKNENYANAIFKKFGWFNSAKLSIVRLSDPIEKSAPFYHKIKEAVENDTMMFADKIRYKASSFTLSQKYATFSSHLLVTYLLLFLLAFVNNRISVYCHLVDFLDKKLIPFFQYKFILVQNLSKKRSKYWIFNKYVTRKHQLVL